MMDSLQDRAQGAGLILVFISLFVNFLPVLFPNRTVPVSVHSFPIPVSYGFVVNFLITVLLSNVSIMLGYIYSAVGSVFLAGLISTSVFSGLILLFQIGRLLESILSGAPPPVKIFVRFWIPYALNQSRDRYFHWRTLPDLLLLGFLTLVKLVWVIPQSLIKVVANKFRSIWPSSLPKELQRTNIPGEGSDGVGSSASQEEPPPPS